MAWITKGSRQRRILELGAAELLVLVGLVAGQLSIDDGLLLGRAGAPRSRLARPAGNLCRLGAGIE